MKTSIKEDITEENEERPVKSKGTKTIQDKRRKKMTAIDITDEVKEMEHNKNKSEEEQKTLSLPENVTVEPQDKEHMDLGLIKDVTSIVDVYLPVSNDDGGLLGDKELEKKAKEYCDLYESSKKEKVENPDQLLEELTKFSSDYNKQINKTSAITIGKDTKYRIRSGTLFNFQKKLVRMTEQNWTEWFSDNYGSKYLRSIQDYMALAKIPNVIRYAFLGKERLMEIKRAIPSNGKDDDPIAVFFKGYQIPIDFEGDSDSSIDDFKKEIDTALAMTKIKEVEKDKEIEIDASKDNIKNLTSMGVKVDKGLIHDLVIIKENGGNVNQYLERKFINGGAEDEIVVSTKKVKGFPKIVATLKDTVDYLKDHTDLTDKIDSSGIATMEQSIADLKELINQ